MKYDKYRKHIPNELKRFIIENSNGECAKCKKKAISVKWVRGVPILYDEKAKAFEFNHIISPIDGGKTEKKNMNLLCQKCNRSDTKKNRVMTKKIKSVIGGLKVI